MKTTLLLVLALFATLLFSAVSIASLGEAEASIEDDCLAVSGMEGPPQVREGYTMHPVIADGVTLREFTTPGGIVFGVAWDGVRTPDLTRILGSFSTECEDASKGARVPGRRWL